MKLKILSQVIAAPLFTILFFVAGCATAEPKPATDAQAQDHEGHHPESQASTAEKGEADMMGKSGMMDSGMMNNGMMEKMDKKQMMGMMQQCMAMHKDGKMCNHQMMAKCEENMTKPECTKMMSQMKKGQKSSKTKK